MKVNIKFAAAQSMDYDIFIDEPFKLDFSGKAAIVTNETIAKLHLDEFKKRVNAK